MQPTWSHCLICGDGAARPDGESSAGQHPPPPPPQQSPGGGGGWTPAGLALIAVICVVGVAVLGVGALFLLGTTADEDEPAASGTRSGSRSATVTSEPLDPVDQASYVDMFTTLTLAGFASEGLEVDRTCAHAVASEPENAPVIAEALDGATSEGLVEPAVERRIQPVTMAILRECVGLEQVMIHVLVEEEGLSPPSAACVAAAFAADPAMVAAFEALADYEPTPQMAAAMLDCLTPAEIEAMATGR